VETETAVVFGEVEIHVIELSRLVVCHHTQKGREDGKTSLKTSEDKKRQGEQISILTRPGKLAVAKDSVLRLIHLRKIDATSVQRVF
jgi:hypothetical protein